jgi:aspartate aminotransferase
MSNNTTSTTPTLVVSKKAQNLIGSEIIKLAGEIREKIKQGEKIHNLTIGDFDPKVFAIPSELKDEIVKAYQSGETNYPEANGVVELRKAVSSYLKTFGGLDYSADQVLIAGGARPLIYATFQTLVDPGETVVFPVPSWNNNHYAYLSHAKSVVIETKPEENFMPTADQLAPYVQEATLIAICSPLNPTGTIFSKASLEAICDLVLAENARRGPNQKPLYLMYDQIYWALTFGDAKHYDPVSLRPEMRHYTIFIDGMSKAFAATGIRVGWSFGPAVLIDKMKSILTHIGAWAPKAEQVASAKYLENHDWIRSYNQEICNRVERRLVGFHNGIQQLKKDGFKVDSISPQGAIYLTVRFSLHGLKTADGTVLETTKEVTKYLLDEAKIALVPFYAFGSSSESSWYRLSVGTCRSEDIEPMMASLRIALEKLTQ